MASSAERKGAIEKIQRVQVDGLVALKIIKHCQEDGSSTEQVNGFLVGLVVGSTLEVTNCFPLPKSLTDAKEENEYQIQILSSLRKVNADYHQVGWYQSAYLGTHLNRELLESHVDYQTAIHESIVLIYDPLRTARGNLSLSAYRLSATMLEMMATNDPFTPESVMKAGIKHDQVFEELSVVLRSSHLVSALLCQLQVLTPNPPPMSMLSLANSQEMQRHLQLLMESVENLQQETHKLLFYERSLAKQQQMKLQFIQRRKEENIKRAAHGEKPLPLDNETIEKELTFKLANPPVRRDTLLVSGQVSKRCEEIGQLSGQVFSKLYLAEALQK